MEVKLADERCFCPGVKRAVDLAYEEVEKKGEGENIYTLGQIVHNNPVVDDLAREGIEPIDGLHEIERGKVIIRAHGELPETRREIERSDDLSIAADGTCPFVQKALDYARQMDEEGYNVLILGEEGHPEVEAQKSYGNGTVIGDENDIYKLEDMEGPFGMTFQTTLSKGGINKTIPKIIYETDDLRIRNTRCDATEKRQEAAKELTREVDGMVVVGGHHSSNTTRLAEICSEEVPTCHIETVEELRKEMDKNWFRDNKIETVGLTGGASTPEEYLGKMYKMLDYYQL